MNMADAAKGINAITGLVKAPFDIGLGITNAVQRRKDRKLQEKQLQQQENQFNKTFAETQKQNTIGNIMAERNQGMNAIDMLANQRYAAMNKFQNQSFKDALFNAMR
jgi:hypothetical protein